MLCIDIALNPYASILIEQPKIYLMNNKHFFPSLILFGLLFTSSLFAQKKAVFGPTLRIGLSQQKFFFFPPEFEASFPPILSGAGGFFYEQRFNQKSRIGAQLLWVQMNGRNHRIIHGSDSFGQFLVSFSGFLDTYSSYIGIPIYYQHNLGKIGLKVGIQPLFLLSASATSKKYSREDPNELEIFHHTENLDFSFVDFGPQFGVNYQLTERVRLAANYYLGLTNIAPPIGQLDIKNRQFDIGVDYTL